MRKATDGFMDISINGDNGTEIKSDNGKDFEDAENIILIGMPYSNKKQVGREIARITKRKFYYSGDFAAARYGVRSENIISRYGEERFLYLESRAISTLCRRRASVICCSCGAVMRDDNFLSMSNGGRIFYISRQLKDIKDLLPEEISIKELEARYEMYREKFDFFADYTVRYANVTITAKRIIDIFNGKI